MPRPSDFTNELALQICERLADGESLRRICADAHMPGKTTVFRWLADPDMAAFRALYATARELQADSFAEDIVDIADRPLEAVTTIEKMVACDHVLEPVTETRTADAVDRSKLMVDARKWAASKLAPKKYGDKLELSGSVGHESALDEIERLEAEQRARAAAAPQE